MSIRMKIETYYQDEPVIVKVLYTPNDNPFIGTGELEIIKVTDVSGQAIDWDDDDEEFIEDLMIEAEDQCDRLNLEDDSFIDEDYYKDDEEVN